jgi:hypothetical protein
MSNFASKNKHGAREIYHNGSYLKYNSTWHEEDSAWKATQINTILEKNKICPNTISEVGCGAGGILTELSKKLPNTYFCGYEISPQAYEICIRKTSKRIEYKRKNIFEEDMFYECILCIDVFEHIEDYIGFLKALKSKANYKIFHIPIDINVLSILRDSLMRAREKVGHLHYFTQSTAIATIKDSGYEIIDSFFTIPFNDLPSKTLGSKILKPFRKLLFFLAPNLMVKQLGGCSLLVLAK